MPPEYILMRAARWMNVAPWDAAEQPASWVSWAIEFEQAEKEAEIEANKKAQRDAERQRAARRGRR